MEHFCRVSKWAIVQTGMTVVDSENYYITLSNRSTHESQATSPLPFCTCWPRCGHPRPSSDRHSITERHLSISIDWHPPIVCSVGCIICSIMHKIQWALCLFDTDNSDFVEGSKFLPAMKSRHELKASKSIETRTFLYVSIVSWPDSIVWGALISPRPSGIILHFLLRDCLT